MVHKEINIIGIVGECESNIDLLLDVQKFMMH